MYARNKIPTLIYVGILMLSMLTGIVRAQGNQYLLRLAEESNSESLLVNHLSAHEDFSDSTKFIPTGMPIYVIANEDLPQIRTQDFAPICALFCATALVEIEDCRRKQIKPCNRLPDEQRISVVGMKIYSDNIDKPRYSSTGIGPIPYEHREVYEILDKVTLRGGDVILYSESCLNYENFVSQFNHDGRQHTATRVKALFTELQSRFSLAQAEQIATKRSPAVDCKECQAIADVFRQRFGIASTPAEVRDALTASSFNQFLYLMIFDTQDSNPRCRDLSWKRDIHGRAYFEHFPELTASRSDTSSTSVDELFTVLEEKIKANIPVSLSGICTSQNKNSKRCNSHCFIVTGLRTVRSVSTGAYVKLVRVGSSLGEEWHTANNNGWVRVDRLKELMVTADDINIQLKPSNRRNVFPYMMSWLRQ